MNLNNLSRVFLQLFSDVAKQGIWAHPCFVSAGWSFARYVEAWIPADAEFGGPCALLPLILHWASLPHRPAPWPRLLETLVIFGQTFIQNLWLQSCDMLQVDSKTALKLSSVRRLYMTFSALALKACQWTCWRISDWPGHRMGKRKPKIEL